LENKAKSQGATKSGKYGGYGTITMLLLVTNRGFQGCVGGPIAVMKNPVVVAPKFWSFLLHIFSQASQNATNVCSVRRNKFTVNNPVEVEKNNEHALSCTPDLLCLFCS
jgi:hypothetical protein